MKLPPRSATPATHGSSRKDTELDAVRAASRHAYQLTFVLVSVAAAVIAACVIAELVD